MLLSSHVNERNATEFFTRTVKWLDDHAESVCKQDCAPVARTAGYCIDYLNGLTLSCAVGSSTTEYANRLHEIREHLRANRSDLDLLYGMAGELHQHSKITPVVDRFLDISLPILRGKEVRISETATLDFLPHLAR